MDYYNILFQNYLFCAFQKFSRLIWTAARQIYYFKSMYKMSDSLFFVWVCPSFFEKILDVPIHFTSQKLCWICIPPLEFFSLKAHHFMAYKSCKKLQFFPWLWSTIEFKKMRGGLLLLLNLIFWYHHSLNSLPKMD